MSKLSRLYITIDRNNLQLNGSKYIPTGSSWSKHTYSWLISTNIVYKYSIEIKSSNNKTTNNKKFIILNPLSHIFVHVSRVCPFSVVCPQKSKGMSTKTEPRQKYYGSPLVVDVWPDEILGFFRWDLVNVTRKYLMPVHVALFM